MKGKVLEHKGEKEKHLKKWPYRLLRSSLLRNHFSKMCLYGFNDPEEHFIAHGLLREFLNCVSGFSPTVSFVKNKNVSKLDNC